MSALGLAAIVALVAAALLAALLWFRRRRPAPRPGPRTVAELVQMRAAAAKAEPGPAAEVQAEVSEESGSTPSEAEPDRPAVPEPAPVVATRRPDPPATERNGRVAVPATSDTPWARALRMTGAEAPGPPMTSRPCAAADDSTGVTGVSAPAIPDPTVDLDDRARAEPQPTSTADIEGAAPAELQPAAASDSCLAPLVDLGSTVPAEHPPAAAADSRPAPTPDLDNAALVGSQRAATDSRPTPTPELDHSDPVERPAIAAADSRPAPTADLDGPAPAEPQLAGTADLRPAGSDAPDQLGETEEQASRRVLRLVPPLPADSAIPVQRTQAPDPELALLGALGLVDPAADPEPALAGVARRRSRPENPGGPARQIRFRIARRDGSAVPGAEVGLLDEDGQHVTTGYADADGCGELAAPHPGSYLLVCVAPEHQPGVATVSVVDGPGEATLLVARSAVLTGSVRASYTPVVAARLTVVQDGEIVGGTHSDSVGAYRISDLGSGGYGLCVTAPGCLPAVVRVDIADGTELQRDIELQRAGDVQREAVESAGELPEQATAADRRVVGHR